MNYRLVNSNAYLMHYGVKGMKWGVRKEYVPKGRRQSSGMQSRQSKGAIDVLLADPELTTYATLTVALLAYHGGKRISDLHKQGWFTEKYEASDVKRCRTTKEEDLKLINPLKGVSEQTIEKLPYIKSISELSKAEQKELTAAMKDGWMDNCVYCTTAGALRRKGYDVEAKNSPGRGHSTEQMMKWWKGSKIESFDGRSESNPKKADNFVLDAQEREGKKKRSDSDQLNHMSQVLQKQGVGAYGEMRVYGFFCGHSVGYSVEKEGVMIHDNQVRHSYKLDDYFKTHDHFYPSSSVYMRLDTCEPDLDRILKEHAVKPRGK